MRYRKLTGDGDMTFGSGLLNFYIDVPQAVGQAVQTSLLLWLGEWYLDIDEGTPYMEGIIGKHPKETADNTLQARVRSVQGVVNYTNYVSVIEPNERGFTVSFDLNTIYGVTQLQVANYANF